MKALHTYYVAAAAAINAENPSLPALVAMSTKRRLPSNTRFIRSQKGLRVPGPVPFTPLAVGVVSTRAHDVSFCVLDSGWGIDRKTKKVAGKRKLVPAVARAVRVDGRWRIDSIKVGGFSCKGVAVG